MVVFCPRHRCMSAARLVIHLKTSQSGCTSLGNLEWPRVGKFGLAIRATATHALHTCQQRPKKRMGTKRGRIAHQQQLAPCAGHAHVHAADVRQEADLALGVAARQGDGRDAALLALKRIDGAHAEPALQRQIQRQLKIYHTNVWIFL